MQYCIDKAATVEQATNGQGVPVEADIPPASWAYNPDLQTVERDVPAAIGFLEEAGWTVEVDADGNATGPATRDGVEFATDVYVRAGRPDRIAFMELLRDQVVDCGIVINVIEADFATVLRAAARVPAHSAERRPSRSTRTSVAGARASTRIRTRCSTPLSAPTRSRSTSTTTSASRTSGQMS